MTTKNAPGHYSWGGLRPSAGEWLAQSLLCSTGTGIVVACDSARMPRGQADHTAGPQEALQAMLFPLPLSLVSVSRPLVSGERRLLRLPSITVCGHGTGGFCTCFELPHTSLSRPLI